MGSTVGMKGQGRACGAPSVASSEYGSSCDNCRHGCWFPLVRARYPPIVIGVAHLRIRSSLIVGIHIAHVLPRSPPQDVVASGLGLIVTNDDDRDNMPCDNTAKEETCRPA